MRAWKRMRGVIGTHLGLPRGELIRGWAVRPDSDAWLAAQYEAHNAQVRVRVPRGKLLEFNVTEEGCMGADADAPLCSFLASWASRSPRGPSP